MTDSKSRSPVRRNNKDVVVLLSPTGRGAVATVLVNSQIATERVDEFFKAASGRPLRTMLIGRIVYGTWQLGPDQFEEVVVCRRDGLNVEVHCHGGRVVTQAVVDSLVESGCEAISWQEGVTQTEVDAITAAARVALATARTQRVAAILLDQYRGVLRASIDQCVALLETGQFESATKQLNQLQRFSELGEHLVRPWQVVVAGPPNVGKSSLINVILGYERSIVFDQPGTTRDVLRATTALDGWPVELRDTAGLREHQDPVETQGIELAREQIASADLVVLVFDASCPWSRDEVRLCEQTESVARRMIVVDNKVDIAQRLPPNDIHLLASAKSGEGIDGLIAAITNSLIPTPPLPGTAIPFTREQRLALEKAMALATDGNAEESVAALARV